MAVIPYMRFYVSDYMADTSDLSTLEHGAYLLLIFAYWHKKGPISNDPERLAAITRMSKAKWIAIEPKLAGFFVDEGSTWRHERIEEELEEVISKSLKCSGANAFRESLNTPGFVYLMSRSDGHIKIGSSDNPNRRLTQVKNKTKDHFCKIIARFPTERMGELESSLHVRFASKRVVGEWFALSAADIDAITSEFGPSPEGVTGGVTGCHPIIRASASVSESKLLSEKQETPSGDSVPRRLALKLEFMSNFWQICWHKVGKGDAEKAYALQRKAGFSMDQICDAAERQGPHLIEAARLERRSVLHPATWLNGQRFLDDDFDKLPPARGSPIEDKKEAVSQEFRRLVLKDIEAGRA